MPRAPRPRLILGLDPALRTLGWAILRERAPGDVEPLAMGVVRPKRNPDLPITRDNFAAARIIGSALLGLVRWTPAGPGDIRTVDEIRAEAMSYPPGATSAAKISICWGAIATVAELHALPVRQASPQAIKRALCGVPSASKDEVREALEKRFGKRTIARLLAGIPASFMEHPSDALGAGVAIGSLKV